MPNRGSLRIVLSKKQWSQLLQYFHIPASLTTSRASEIRCAVTLAPARKDYRDRAMSTKPGGHRLGTMKFREDDILLPLSVARDAFVYPNPTVFQSAEWPRMDSSDPMDGWDYPAIVATSSSAATNDI